jgi:hypothetical protein
VRLKIASVGRRQLCHRDLSFDDGRWGALNRFRCCDRVRRRQQAPTQRMLPLRWPTIYLECARVRLCLFRRLFGLEIQYIRAQSVRIESVCMFAGNCGRVGTI